MYFLRKVLSNNLINLPSFAFINKSLEFNTNIYINAFCLAKNQNKIKFIIKKKMVLRNVASFGKLWICIFPGIF